MADPFSIVGQAAQAEFEVSALCFVPGDVTFADGRSPLPV